MVDPAPAIALEVHLILFLLSLTMKKVWMGRKWSSPRWLAWSSHVAERVGRQWWSCPPPHHRPQVLAWRSLRNPCAEANLVTCSGSHWRRKGNSTRKRLTYTWVVHVRWWYFLNLLEQISPYTLQFSFLIALYQILRERGRGEDALLNEFPFGCLWDNGEL